MESPHNKLKTQLENCFNPEILKQNLIIASLFIAVFDNFKSSIIDKVKYFYLSGFKDGKEEFREYDIKVLSKVKTKKNRDIKATLLWLRESGAITNEDENKFEELTNMRNNLAHEMSKMLLEGFPEIIYDLYVDMINLFNKIERWWIIEIEIPINPPDIPLENICWNEIQSVNVEFMRIMSEIAFIGNDKYMQMIKNYPQNDLT
jgi:hypothetical protein